MAALKFCAVCRSNYRGSSAVHQSTAKHRANLRGRGRGRAHTGDLRRALGYARVDVRRAVAGDRGEDSTRVRGYRRRRPLDGPQRSVKVRRYWRNKVWRMTYIPASIEELRRRGYVK